MEWYTILNPDHAQNRILMQVNPQKSVSCVTLSLPLQKDKVGV